MGYVLKKKNGRDFRISTQDAAAIRSIETFEGYGRLMPNTESEGEKISTEARNSMIVTFREEAKMLLELVDWLRDAEDIHWTH